MKIDRESLQKIAHLSRLQIKPDEEASLLKSMDSVLSWMEQLNEVDTDGVEPLIHVMDEANNWRQDQGKNTLLRNEALANAPSKNSSYIMVPKVIESATRMSQHPGMPEMISYRYPDAVLIYL